MYTYIVFNLEQTLCVILKKIAIKNGKLKNNKIPNEKGNIFLHY